MKKKMILGFALAASLTAVMGASAFAAAGTGTVSYIGDAKAKAIAFEAAGVTEEDMIFINVHLDRDDWRVNYDVEFYSGNTEYDYEIDAVSGEILEYDHEVDYRADAVTGATVAQAVAGATASATPQTVTGTAVTQARPAAGTTVAQSAATVTVQYISEEDAKAVALADAGLTADQVRKMDIDFDREHGVMVYEIEFKSGQMEYEYEINASDGTLLKSDVEYDD